MEEVQVVKPGERPKLTQGRYYELVQQSYDKVREDEFSIKDYIDTAWSSFKKIGGKDQEVERRREVFVRVSEVLGNRLSMVDDENTVGDYDNFKRTLQNMPSERRAFCRKCLRMSEGIAADLSLPAKEVQAAIPNTSQLMAILV